MTRVALARARELPSFERDDAGFVEVAARHGLQAEWAVWDDPDTRWESFDAVLIRTTWDYCERIEDFRAWVRHVDAVTRLVNPGPIVLWNLDKRYLRDLAEAGVPIAPTVWHEPGADPVPALRAAGWSRGFCKPVVGATARATLRFPCDDAGFAALRAHLAAHPEPMLLQPYLRSVEEQGEVSVVLAGGAISHAVRKIPAAGDYRVQDDWGAVDQPLGLFHGEDAFALEVLHVLVDRFAEVLAGSPPVVARVDTLRDADDRLVLNELELVEPSLFYRHAPAGMDAVAAALAAALRGSDRPSGW